MATNYAYYDGQKDAVGKYDALLAAVKGLHKAEADSQRANAKCADAVLGTRAAQTTANARAGRAAEDRERWIALAVAEACKALNLKE